MCVHVFVLHNVLCRIPYQCLSHRQAESHRMLTVMPHSGDASVGVYVCMCVCDCADLYVYVCIAPCVATCQRW